MNISTKNIAEHALNRLRIRTQKRTSHEQTTKRDVHFASKNTQFCSRICSDEIYWLLQNQNNNVSPHSNLLPDQQKDEYSIKSRKSISWNAEEDALIQWFLSANDLPKSSFQLKQGVYVIDSNKFYKSIQADIDEGPKGARALFGALQDDLICLRNITNRSRS